MVFHFVFYPHTPKYPIFGGKKTIIYVGNSFPLKLQRFILKIMGPDFFYYINFITKCLVLAVDELEIVI